MTQDAKTPEPCGHSRADAPGAERSLPVQAAIAVVAVLFVTLVAIVWRYSWWRVAATPSALVVVEGSSDFEGTVVTIDGANLPSPRRERVAAESSYICRFPLPAGEYSIRIEHVGQVLYEKNLFKIDEHQYALLPLKKLQEKRGDRK